MSDKPCKSKHSFQSEEEAFHLGMPGLKIYLCPHCSNYHQTSKGQGGKKKNDWKWRKRK